ncbi:MAG: branched-chain amino acid transaminase [Nitrospinae bacterium]|nr:branched-chain amino acid transaminase [Nitrospinota bacterium]
MTAPKSDFIWMDGKLVPWDQANVHVLTHTLHYGTGVFEGIRCYKTNKGSAVFRHREHIERLFASAKILGYAIPYSVDEVMKAVRETIKANNLEECYIRPIAFLGTENRGLNPKGLSVHLSIAVWPWGKYLGDEAAQHGIRVCISSFTRHHPNITMSKAKATGIYINSVLAKQDAVRNGYDEAVLLDPFGNVAEGSGENLFVIRNGRIKTPPAVSILEGITRDSIMRLAEDAGIPLVEQFFPRDELYIADEVFLTGTAAEVTPVREVDNRPVGKGSVGPVTQKLHDLFFDALRGKNQKYAAWLDIL